MKKIYLIFLLIIIPFLLIPQLNPSNKIKQPNSKSIWNAGETYKIVWDKVTKKEVLLNISLRHKNLRKPFIIANNIKNEGEYKWNIPTSIQTGKYKIIIKAKGRRFR